MAGSIDDQARAYYGNLGMLGGSSGGSGGGYGLSYGSGYAPASGIMEFPSASSYDSMIGARDQQQRQQLDMQGARDAFDVNSVIEERRRLRDQVVADIGPVQSRGGSGGGGGGGGDGWDSLASFGGSGSGGPSWDQPSSPTDLPPASAPQPQQSLPWSQSQPQQQGQQASQVAFMPKDRASQQDVEDAVRDAALLGIPPERMKKLFDELDRKRREGLNVTLRLDPNYFRPAKGAAALDDKRERVLLLESLAREAKDELEAQDKHLITAKQIEYARDMNESNRVMEYLNRKYEKKWKSGTPMIIGDQVEIRDSYLQTLIGKLADEFFDQRAKDALTKTLDKAYFKELTFTIDEAYVLYQRGDLEYFQEVGSSSDVRKNGYPFLQFYDFVLTIENLYTKLHAFDLQIGRQDRSTDLVQALKKHIMPDDNRPWIFHEYYPRDKRLQRVTDGAVDGDTKEYDVTVGQAVDSADTFDPGHFLVFKAKHEKDQSGIKGSEEKKQQEAAENYYSKLRSSVRNAFPYKQNYTRASTEYEYACREALFMSNEIWSLFIGLKQGLFQVNFTTPPEFHMPEYRDNPNDAAAYSKFVLGDDDPQRIKRGHWVNAFSGPYGLPSENDPSCLQPKYTNIKNYPCNIFGRMLSQATSTTPDITKSEFNFDAADIDEETGQPSYYQLFVRDRGGDHDSARPFQAFEHQSSQLAYRGGGPIGKYNFVLQTWRNLLKFSRKYVEYAKKTNDIVSYIKSRAYSSSIGSPGDVPDNATLFDWVGISGGAYRDTNGTELDPNNYFTASSGAHGTNCAIPVDIVKKSRSSAQDVADYDRRDMKKVEPDGSSAIFEAAASLAKNWKLRPLVNARVVTWKQISSQMEKLIKHPIHVCPRLSDAFTRTRTDDLMLTAYVKRIQDRFFELSRSINDLGSGLTNIFGALTTRPTDLSKLLWLPKCTQDEIYVFKDKDGNPMPYDKAVHFDASSGQMYMDPSVAMEKTECAPRVLAPYIPGVSTKEHLSALIRASDVTRSDFKDSSLARDLVSYLNQSARQSQSEDVASALRDISRKLDLRSSSADTASIALADLTRGALQGRYGSGSGVGGGLGGYGSTGARVPEVAAALGSLASVLSRQYGGKDGTTPQLQQQPIQSVSIPPPEQVPNYMVPAQPAAPVPVPSLFPVDDTKHTNDGSGGPFTALTLSKRQRGKTMRAAKSRMQREAAAMADLGLLGDSDEEDARFGGFHGLDEPVESMYDNNAAFPVMLPSKQWKSSGAPKGRTSGRQVAFQNLY